MFSVVSNFWQKMNVYYKSQIIYDYEENDKRVLIIKPWQIENFFKIIGKLLFFKFCFNYFVLYKKNAF